VLEAAAERARLVEFQKTASLRETTQGALACVRDRVQSRHT
jgi:hypothetical protein